MSIKLGNQSKIEICIKLNNVETIFFETLLKSLFYIVFFISLKVFIINLF